MIKFIKNNKLLFIILISILLVCYFNSGEKDNDNFIVYNYDFNVNDLCRLYNNKTVDLLIPGGNKGDGLIYEGLFNYFRDNDINFNIIKNWKEHENKNKILFICGGGGFSPIYNTNTVYIDLINKYEDIWILPTTFDCSIDVVENFLASLNNKKTKIFCREMKSYNDVKKIFKGNVFIDHDTAFNVDYSKWIKGGNGVLNAIRLDGEKNDSITKLFNNKKINDVSAGNYKEWKILLDEISKYDEVHTNRAHVSIASTLMGKNTFIYPSNYFKQEEIYKYSLSKYSNCKFINI